MTRTAVAGFDRVVDAFFGNTDAAFAKGLQKVGFSNAVQSFKLQVANNGQFFDFEDDNHAAARTFLGINARFHLVEETQREQGLHVALNLLFVERIARAGLHIIKNVFLAQSAVSDDLDILDCALGGLLLSVSGFGREVRTWRCR